MDPAVRVRWSKTMPSNVLGYTDGRSYIWLNRHEVRSQAEARCVLAHELVHLGMGHLGHQPLAVERRVRQAAATLLITLAALASEIRWTQDVHELAEQLGVTPAVLRDRLELPDARSLMERAQMQEWT